MYYFLFYIHLLIYRASLCLPKPQILNNAEIPETLVLLQVLADAYSDFTVEVNHKYFHT